MKISFCISVVIINLTLYFVMALRPSGWPQVRKWSGKNILQGEGKSGNFILSQGEWTF